MKRLLILLPFFFLATVLYGQIAEGRYYIRLANGRALEAASSNFKTNGARMQIWLLYYGLNQLWAVKKVPGETNKYYIMNIGGDMALDADAGSVNNNGCRVQLWQFIPANRNQQWIIQPGAGGGYTIRSVASTVNKVLDVTGGVIDRGGAQIQLWDNLNGPNQTWNFMRSYDSAQVRPNVVDLRLNQSALKNQSPVRERGSCTYFGNIAALEAAYKKRGYGELDLSEEFFATMAKVMYIHPYWNDITSSNRVENQAAGLQGGGTINWFVTGLKIPKENVMPFKINFPDIPNYATQEQKVMDDINAPMIAPVSILKAPLYYGAISGDKIASMLLQTPGEYERILNLGYEIDVGLSIGHNVLIVGYDKTDAAHPKFLVKDSYETPGTRCLSDCNLWNYPDLLPLVQDARYITGVRDPSPFPEVAFIGRWKLDFDGHRGTIDIYHIPGIVEPQLLTSNGGSPVTDKRIGAFTDESGNIYRINGAITGNKIEFYLDLNTPNQRWDELRGRKFTYYLDPTTDIMAGYHKDGDGSTYGGYATKAASYISHGSIDRNFIDRMINNQWTLQWGSTVGTVTTRVGEDGSRVNGTFTNNRTGVTQTFSITYDSFDRSELIIRLGSASARAKFLNHDAGMMCGNDASGQPVLLYKR